MRAAGARIVGFLALTYGVGLRLDTGWQRTALGLIAIGLALALGGLVREAFVSQEPGG